MFDWLRQMGKRARKRAPLDGDFARAITLADGQQVLLYAAVDTEHELVELNQITCIWDRQVNLKVVLARPERFKHARRALDGMDVERGENLRAIAREALAALSPDELFPVFGSYRYH